MTAALLFFAAIGLFAGGYFTGTYFSVRTVKQLMKGRNR